MTITIYKSQIAGTDFEVQVSAFAAEMKAWRAREKRVYEDVKNNVPEQDAHISCPRPRASVLVESAVNENDDADYVIKNDGPTAEQVLTSKKDKLSAEVCQMESVEIEKVFPNRKQRAISLRINDIENIDQSRIADVHVYAQDNAARLTAAQAEAAQKSEALQQLESGAAYSVTELLKSLAGKILDRSTVDKFWSTPELSAARSAVAEADLVVSSINDEAAQIRPTFENVSGFAAESRSAEDTAFLANYEAIKVSVTAIQRWAAQQLSDIEDLTVQNIDTWSVTPYDPIKEA